MKITIRGIAGVIGIAFIILIVANSAVRVGDSSGNIGIIEDKLWGHSIWDFLKPKYSEDYNRWKSALDASGKVAELLQKYGSSELTLNIDLELQRKAAIKLSTIGFENASSITKDYLKENNDELPDKYFSYLVTALDNWQKGLSNKDVELVKQGISKYNDFITWMNSKNRDDFKNIR